ncbi:MAG: hypothetical protein ACR2G5_04630, partial [Pyrinomonadaceae bacterium]
MTWYHQFRASGYAHFPGLTPASLVGAALEAIERDLRDNYDAQRAVEYDNQSYCALEEGRVYSHTATVGVFLTPVSRAYAGNLTVWPGSHQIYESYFRKRGPVSMREPLFTPELGEPVQL